MDTFVTVLALFGAAFLLLILLLTLVIGGLLRRGAKMIREGRWPVQLCIVCQEAISAPDQAVGVSAQAIPGVIADLPPMVRRTLEETPTRFFFAHRTCADAKSVDAADRVAVDSDLAYATLGEQTCPNCQYVFTPAGMAILRPDDPATDRDGFSVACPRCTRTWLAGWRID